MFRYGCFVLVAPPLFITFQLFSFMIKARGPLAGWGESECISRLTSSARNDNRNSYGHFPRIIHQIYFVIDEKAMSDRLFNATQTWKTKNLEFEYILWTSTMVEKLIRSKYPDFLEIYESYGHWVRRVDFAKYLILYEFGGVYVDIDIISTETLGSLLNSFNQQTYTVLYWTRPIGVACDFIISKPRDNFMAHVLCGLGNANRWYVLPYLTSMMATGPLYLTVKYSSFSNRNSVNVTDAEVLRPYIEHIEGSSWHQLDGFLIIWVYQNWQTVLMVLISLTVIIFRVWIYFRLCKGVAPIMANKRIKNL